MKLIKAWLLVLVLTAWPISNYAQNQTNMKLSNIRLLVQDFPSMFSFYHDTLGLNCTWGDKDNIYASFDIGLPSGLALFKQELMAEAIHDTSSQIGQNESFAIVIEVDQIDLSFAALKEKGVHFITEPKDMPAWGIRVAHFRDPEGNLVEIFSPLEQD